MSPPSRSSPIGADAAATTGSAGGDDPRLKRWRLLLGGDEADGTGMRLGGDELAMDQALAALYDADRTGGLAGSAPRVARWLGDIRTYFPASVVQVMQRDALERLKLKEMLLQPELLSEMVPDVHLVGTLLALQHVLPDRTRDTARQVVRRVVDDLLRKLESPLRQAVGGSLHRGARNRRPRHAEIDWHRTIRQNLRHWQPDRRFLIPDTRVGFGRKRSSLVDVILLIDQSASMATSVVYAGVMGAVLASLPSLSTHAIAFDTNVVDLTEKLADPVELLFGVQLGGGTDINRALAYGQSLVARPAQTLVVLVSDLYEGGNRDEMLHRARALSQSGVTVLALLALSDDGAPAYDHAIAAALAALGIPAFACTPDLFPDLLAAALRKQDLAAWAAAHGIVTARQRSAP